MIRPTDEYPGKTGAPSANYPDGSAQNITTPGDGTGTPWEAKLVNDIFGFQQFITSLAGITPSGTSDNAVTSQQFEALWTLLNTRPLTYNLTSDANYTLTATQNLYKLITITDTGVVLTTGRDIIVDDVARLFVFVNSTVQTLTVKTLSGTGVAVPAGESSIVLCDGTDITLLNTVTPTADTELANKKYVDDNVGGVVLQEVNVENNNLIQGVGVITPDDTIPQITEGFEILTATITPLSTTSTLRVEVTVHANENSNTSDQITFALFRDSTSDAIAAAQINSTQNNTSIAYFANFSKSVTSGSTSPTTFKLRGGLNTSNTLNVNGRYGGRALGGALVTAIRILEIEN